MHSDLSIYEEYLSAIIPWIICLHNLFWCSYFFYKFGCCKNKFPAFSIGMKRSASLVFTTHVIAPFLMGFSNFYLIIPLFHSFSNTIYPCKADFIIDAFLYAFCKFALFLFFTFRVDVILRDSFFEYKRLQSWMVRLFGFIGFIAIIIYVSIKIDGTLDDDNDFCLLDTKSYLPLYIGVAINASFFLIVTVIFARKICQVTRSSSTAMRLQSKDIDDSGIGFEELSYSTNVNNESFKLIETLQYHTLLIVLNVIIELILLFVSRYAKIIAICLSLSVFVDIWCLLLMFRKTWFKRYCNFCLTCTKPLWKYICCVSLPELYNGYNYSSAEYNNNDSQHFIYGPTDTELANTKSLTIWNTFKRNKSNSTKKKKYKSNEHELYQPLTQEYM
eukprot:61730_1